MIFEIARKNWNRFSLYLGFLLFYGLNLVAFRFYVLEINIKLSTIWLILHAASNNISNFYS